MSKKQVKPNKTSIGGQAVMEGVMMRGKTAMATAVRDADGVIRMETVRLAPPESKSKFSRLPFVRGSFNFISSMIGGTKTLMRSAEVYGEGEPSKFEKWLADKLKINLMSVITFLSMFIGIGLAVVLFILAPIWLRRLIEIIVGKGFTFGLVAKNFIEGGFKILIFVSYILLVSLLKDIRRTFMYHGAEHKTISCYEMGKELTVENAATCPRVHDRCGTTFMFLVIIISILVFALVESLFGIWNISIEKIWRVLLKIALLPVVAGISYELLKALAKTESKIVVPIKAPGLLLQRITTREPTPDMLEVAIAAFNKVLEMDADPTIQVQKFVVAEKRKELTTRIIKRLNDGGVEEAAEGEWIVALTLGVERSEVYTDAIVSPKNVEEIEKITTERLTGRPLWYCIGDTEFYGYKIKTDERALIPRPETEELVENALKSIKPESRVLDLCTGSGAIAIAVNKKSGAAVTAADISADALALANENAEINSAQIEFVESDLFENLSGRVFDVIVTNPPYIVEAEIDGLQREISFEPRIALDGGADGLDFYRRIAKDAPSHMAAGGVLFAECGIGQATVVAEMFGKSEIIKDLNGVERIVKAEF